MLNLGLNIIPFSLMTQLLWSANNLFTYIESGQYIRISCSKSDFL